MTTYHAPSHAGMRYPAFVEPDSPGPLRDPDSKGFPRVDEQLVRPEAREEMVRGRRIHAAPALAPHADHHQVLSFVTGGCIAPGYIASTDLLTRVGLRSDFATDTCIRREGIDPSTGARYLEELAFEIVGEQSLRDITERAEDLSERGIRKIIAIFVKRGEVCEWSSERGEWQVLESDGVLEDPTLAEPIPIRALLDLAEAEQTVVRALRTKGNPAVLSMESRAKEEGRTEGRAEGHADGARGAIEAFCRAFDIPLGSERRTDLQQQNAGELESLFAHLLRERQWPS